MSTITAPPAAPALPKGDVEPILTAGPENPVRRGPILLAINGKEPTAAPIQFAHRLAHHLAVGLEVVTVGEPVYAYRGELGVGIVPMTLMYEDVVRVQEDVIRRRVREVCGEAGWGLTVRYGAPSREILRRAAELDATLIIVAAAPHRVLRHDVSGVRALQILRGASCPVLSITPDLRSLPRTIVAGIDFSPASVRATEAALLMLESGGTLVLAHVPLPLPIGREVQDREGALFGIDVGETFERLRDELRPYLPAKATLETRQLEGRVAGELLALADDVGADLVTVGRHSRNVIERFFVGSVATTVIHGAQCSVLASPDPSAAEKFRLKLRFTDSATTERSSDWAEILGVVSERNVGRRVTVEEAGYQFGAQVQVQGFVLTGIDYDPETRRVDMMMNPGDSGSGHLTRTIEDVDAIGIKVAPGGDDEAIEIQHGNNRTLIVFET